MNRFPIILLVLFLVSGVFFLTGCGGGGTDGSVNAGVPGTGTLPDDTDGGTIPSPTPFPSPVQTGPTDCTASVAGYGEEGSYTVATETFENPAWEGGTPVTVFFPAERTERAPVVFYSHGFGGTNWAGYGSLITHLASRGFVVVHSPYPTSGTDVPGRYQIMWNGFQMAAERYASRMDLRKTGFMGHSFGGGAVPAMAWKGIVEKGWGSEGAFLFLMAPWYSYELTDSQLMSFPAHVKVVVQVYDEDTINDHRMGMDIFNNISVPGTEKAYYNVVPGTLPAGHSVPSDRELNELDRLAVRRPVDALADYSFGLTACAAEGKRFALDGAGERFQHTVTKTPAPVAGESAYDWPWSSLQNPRR